MRCSVETDMVVCTMSIPISLRRLKKFKKYILFFNPTLTQVCLKQGAREARRFGLEKQKKNFILLRFIGIVLTLCRQQCQYQDCTSFHSQVICKKTNMSWVCLQSETCIVRVFIYKLPLRAFKVIHVKILLNSFVRLAGVLIAPHQTVQCRFVHKQLSKLSCLMWRSALYMALGCVARRYTQVHCNIDLNIYDVQHGNTWHGKHSTVSMER